MLRLRRKEQASSPTSIRQTVRPVSTANRIVLPSGDEATQRHPSTQRGRCRHCGARLVHTFVDLGMSPLCESFLDADQLDEMEPFRSEEHTSELQSQSNLVCRLLLEKK